MGQAAGVILAAVVRNPMAAARRRGGIVGPDTMRRPPVSPRDDSEAAPTAGAVERRQERLLQRPTTSPRDDLLRRQRSLAERVVSFMRDQPTSTRAGLAAGALLLAASGAALAYDVVVPEDDGIAAVEPLQAEVREGLPTAPGRYAVVPESIVRDVRGVYHFSWLEAAGGPTREARVSLLRLAPGERVELEIAASGDPVLYTLPDQPIGVVQATDGSQGTSSSGSSSGSRPGFFYVGSWYPYLGGGYSAAPVYRAPPAGSTLAPGGRIGGSIEALAPPAPAARTIGVPPRADAVSGQARGTGGGTAATSRIGSSPSSSGVSAPRSGGFSSGIGGGGTSGVS